MRIIMHGIETLRRGKGKMIVLKDRGFYKKTALLMLPVILQQLITVGINFLDNIMIGSFGEVSIAAAAFSNQAYAFFQFTAWAWAAGR